MNEKKLAIVMALFFGCTGFFACSNRDEAKSEPQKGVIEEMTDKAAQKAINRIRTPLNKARSVAEQEEDRLSDMDQSLKD